jgi:hypothetical protein
LIKRRANSIAAIKSSLASATPSASSADGVLRATGGVRRKAMKRSAAVTGPGASADEGAVTKVIRDSFTMPVIDYARIGVLKQRCIGLGLAVKKSELLRAGLHVLGRISDQDLAQVVAAVENVKTGRPPGKKRKKSDRTKDKKQ